MGMYDWYIPIPKLSCPVCGRELLEWQGKDGPCALFTWKQWKSAAIDQKAGENNISESERALVQLPSTFRMYSNDCNCPYPVEAFGYCIDGIWKSTSLVMAENASHKKYERKEGWRKRERWLKSSL
jgi:hypothetical protein